MYIRPQDRDTRYALWFERYECRVPYIQTLSIEEIEENGLFTSGDKHHDHATQWEPILMAIPIVRMATLWSTGANVRLVKRSDAPKIYEAIQKHLEAWKHHIATSYHVVTPPYDDLLLLDQFANIIYEHAKFVFDTRFVEERFKLTKSTAIGRRALIHSIMQEDERRQEDEERGILRTRNIEVRIPAPKYDENAPDLPAVDYSGKKKLSKAPDRQSLSSFFKKDFK